MTTIRTLIRTLSVAAVLAAASLPALPAHAEDNGGSTSQPEPCASRKADGSWDFHAPDSNPPSTATGTRTRTNANGSFVEESANGVKYTCTKDGWVQSFVAPSRPSIARPIGGVLTQQIEPATGLPQLVQIQTGGAAAQP